MNKARSEMGRSLLETLSILVVMAILLLVSVAGYNFVIHQWRKQQTVKQISELAVRYRVRPVQPGEGKNVVIKTIYPESERVDAITLRSSDGGRVSLQVEDTSAFSVVAEGILDESCESTLENGEYDGVRVNNKEVVIGQKSLKDFNFNSLSKEVQGALKGINITAGMGKKEVISKICGSKPLTLVYGEKCPKMGGSWWYKGRCWSCPQAQKEDKYGNCCSEKDLNDCGVCNDKATECKVNSCLGNNKTVCDNDKKDDLYGTCVECFEDRNCTCRTDNKKVCDKSTHTCVECADPGKECETSDGKDGFCTRYHTCEPCDTKTESKHLFWNEKLEECGCKTPLLDFNATCDKDAKESCCKVGTTCYEGKCVECWFNHDPKNPNKEGSCSSDRPLCDGGRCRGCSAQPGSANEECSELCGCDSSKGLYCNAGTCDCLNDKVWNGAQCVECTQDKHCEGRTDGKTVCDIEKYECTSCPTGFVWNGTECVCPGGWNKCGTTCCANGCSTVDSNKCKVACEGSGNGCQKCDDSEGDWIPDTSKNGNKIGTCGKCSNGTVVKDTSVTETTCKKCNISTWQLVNESNGSNKQPDGQCCVGGELKNDEIYCPKSCAGSGNGCQKCDANTGEWVADPTKNETPIGDCKKCSDGNVVSVKNGTKVGTCGKCSNGAVVKDTSVTETTCKKCNTSTWQLVNEDNGSHRVKSGSNKGKCCINGAVKHNDTYCPAPKSQVCVPLNISTTKTSQSVFSKAETKSGKYYTVYRLKYKGTITPAFDLKLNLSMYSIRNIGTPKIYVKGNGVNINLKYSDLAIHTGEYEAFGRKYSNTVTLKAGNSYTIDIDIYSLCHLCLIDTKCAFYQ